MRGLKEKKGFTLLEILLAAVILSLIFSLIYQSFRSALAASEFTAGRSELYQSGRFLLNRLAAELNNLARNEEEPLLSGEKDKIEFKTHYGGILKSVAYGHEEKENILYRRTILLPEAQEEAEKETVAENLWQISFRYFDGQNWLEVWEDDEPPASIEIKTVWKEEAEEVKLRTKIALWP